MKRIFLLAFGALLYQGVNAQNTVIPKPQKLIVENGFYRLNQGFQVEKKDITPEVDYFAKQLKSQTTVNFQTVNKSPNLRFAVLKKNNHPEGYYQLTVDKTGILISAPDHQGILYGLQTLLQMTDEHQKDLTIPYLNIEDYPKFGYRGMMLDVGRHFFTVENIKNFLDYLAAYKYNKFHWHLTEDQGWRIQIKKYPKLTEIGAYRDSTLVGPFSDQTYEKKKYGGFYTQDQIKEVVAYAAKLHIDVIPEIEMPGHSQAAIAAYPELGCTDKKVGVWPRWGVSEDIYCPKESTFKFLENVLDEVMPLFPYKYIHIGGDEAPKEAWKNSAFCQDLIKKMGLKDEAELQSYFITRMEKYVNSKGKQIIGWNEILEGGLAPNATVQSWTGIQGGIAAAKSRHKAVMSPIQYTYFSRYQGNPETQLLGPGGFTSLKMVYDYNPIPTQLSADEAKYIWGTEGALWTEYITDFKKVQYMALPRMMALSEVAWGTADPEAYSNFENRVEAQLPTLKQKGIDYSNALFEVNGKTFLKDGKLYYELSSKDGADHIRFTTDHTNPGAESKIYQNPISIIKNLPVKAAYFKNGKRMGAINSQQFDFSEDHKILVKFPDYSNQVRKFSTNEEVLRYENTSAVAKSKIEETQGNISVIVDLGRKNIISGVRVKSFKGKWSKLPQAINLYVSDDGVNYKQFNSRKVDEKNNGNVQIGFGVRFLQFLKIEIQGLEKSADEDSIDEIEIY